MAKCLNPKCNNEIEVTPGRRPKEYCSNSCKQSAHRERLKKEKETLKKEKATLEFMADIVASGKTVMFKDGLLVADGDLEKILSGHPLKLGNGEIYKEGEIKEPGFEGILPAIRKQGISSAGHNLAIEDIEFESVNPNEVSAITGPAVTINITEDDHVPQKKPGESSIDFRVRKIEWEEKRLKAQQKSKK